MSESDSPAEEPPTEGATTERVEVRLWEGEPVHVWRDRWGLPELRVFKTVGSTNDVAREMAEAGAPEGATALAETQTRGRGRRGREWASHDQQSISLSMVIRPKDPGSESVLSIRLGLASARAIEACLPLAVGVKWPNDLMVGDRKVGGILCEGVLEGDAVAFVIAGHGINVHQPDHLWAGELAERATSLAESTDAEIDRLALLGRIIEEWLAVLNRPADRLSAEEVAEFDRRDMLRGRSVTVDGAPAGVVEGVEAEGTLRVRQEGVPGHVVSGTIRHLDGNWEGRA